MPLTEKGKEVLAAMRKQYGAEEGERVFYASSNKGTITGVHDEDILTVSTLEEPLEELEPKDESSIPVNPPVHPYTILTNTTHAGTGEGTVLPPLEPTIVYPNDGTLPPPISHLKVGDHTTHSIAKAQRDYWKDRRG